MTNTALIKSDRAQANYRELMQQFRDPPQSVRNSPADARELESKLAAAEHALFENPPPYQNASGVWVPRAKGLITADEARAKAEDDHLAFLHSLEMPKARRIRQDFQLFDKRDWPDLLRDRTRDEALNRPLVRFILDQDGDGSCASAGYTGVTMFCESKQSNDDLEPLCELALYRLVNGGRDGGSSLSDNVAAGAKHGVPSERVWPRSKGWRAEPSDEAKQDALRHRIDEYWRVSDVQEFGTALLLGMVVYCGYSGHAWFAVDLEQSDPTGRIVWCNSWGTDWSDGGFGTLKFSSVEWGYGCWAMRTARRPS